MTVISVIFWLMFGFGVYIGQNEKYWNIPELITCLAIWPVMLGMGMSERYMKGD